MKKLIQPEILTGFEIEARWPFSSRGDLTAEKKAKKYLLEHLKELEYSPEELDICKKIFFEDDSSIKKKRGRIALELVTPPLQKELAVKLLLDIFKWMRTIGAETDSSCGLHINMGFVPKKKAAEVDYLNLLKIVDQQTILKQFKRANNKNCTPTTEVLDEALAWRPKLDAYLSAQEKIERQSILLARAKNAAQRIRVKLMSQSLNVLADKTKNESRTAQQLLLQNHKQLKQIATNIKSALEDTCREHAIIERKSQHGAYFEFRMTGNANYQCKEKQILAVIDHYETSLLKSIRPAVVKPQLQYKEVTLEVRKPLSRSQIMARYA